MAKKKTTLDSLAASIAKIDQRMRRGFASLEARMEKNFSAVANDLADIDGHMASKHDLLQAEKRLVDRIDSVRIKVDGLQNERDAEVLSRKDEKIPERVAKLEQKVFGQVRR